MVAGKAIWRGLKLLVVPVIVAVFVLVLRHIGLERILAAMRRADRPTLAAATGLHLAVFLLWCLRWQQLMRRSERKSIFGLLPIYMAGVFGNIVTPGARVGGEPIRAHYMSRVYGGERTAYLGTILADKFGNGAVFLLFLFLSVNYVALSASIGLASKLAMEAVAVLVVVLIVVLVLLRRHVGRAFRSLRKLIPLLYASRPMRSARLQFHTCEEFETYLTQKVMNVLNPIRRAAGSATALAKVFCLSAAAWLVFCQAHYVLFVGLGADVDFLHVVIIVTVSTFLGDVSVAPGGAGFMETAMIGMCAAFGVDAGTSAAVTLISRGIFYAYGLGAGGLCLAAMSIAYGREPPPPDSANARGAEPEGPAPLNGVETER